MRTLSKSIGSLVASVVVAIIISPLDDMAVATGTLLYVDSPLARALILPLVYCGIMVWYFNRRWS